MGSGHQWHPQIEPSRQRWPLVPALRQDEIFSSWLARCALNHACSPLELAHQLWPQQQVWGRDCDRCVSQLELGELAALSGLLMRDLASSSLLLICRLLGSPTPSTKVTPWVLCLGARNTRRAGGLQFCPLCFSEPSPYYRIQWRLAWNTCCPTHHVQLRDCCPRCSATISPHRLASTARTLSRCHRCDAYLAEARAVEASPAALAFARQADSVVAAQECQFGSKRLSASEWFGLLRWVHHLVRDLVLHRGKAGRVFLEVFDIDMNEFPAASLGLPLECLSTSDRTLFLGAVQRIACRGVDGIVAAIAQAALPASSYRSPAGVTERCLGILHNPLPCARAAPTKCRGERNPAHSRASVLRKWQRFKRKAVRCEVGLAGPRSST